MKILRLDLRAFGPFSGVTLDLSAGTEGFHLVYGRNEAGKSSALRALRNLLYGIPERTPDNFVHDYRRLRIAALLARGDGQRLEMVRRKAKKDTLFPADEKEPLDESVLRSFLGGCDHDQFQTMFGIDHKGLIAGGQDILHGQGEIGQVLFAAGAGISDLRTTRDSLENEAKELFKPSGSTPKLNKSLSDLKKTRKLIQDKLLPTGDWQMHKTALDGAIARLVDVEKKLTESSRERSRLQRLSGALRVIGRLKRCEAELDRLGDVPCLAPSFAESRRDAVSGLETAKRVEQEALTEIAQLDSQIAGLTVPEELVCREQEIESLYKKVGAHKKAQNDLPVLVAQRKQFEEKALALLREMRPDLTLANADELKLSRRGQVEIQELGNQKARLDEQLAQSQEAIATAHEQLIEIAEQLAQLPPALDPAALVEAVRLARAQGNLMEQAAKVRAEVATMTEQVAIELNRLGLWSGPCADLERLPFPSTETIDRFDRTLADAKSEVASWHSQMEQARANAAGVQLSLEQLSLEGNVPSESDLSNARKLRDAGWRLVLQAWRDEPFDRAALADFLAAVGASDLAAAYEHVVRAADDLSDRLRREAERVANRANLQVQHASLQQQATENERKHLLAAERLRQIEARWNDTWLPLKIEPLPPREMQAWIRRQQELVAASGELRKRTTVLGQMENRMDEHGRQVRSCLESLHFESVTAAGSPSLDALLSLADDVIERTKNSALERRRLESENIRIKKNLNKAEGNKTQAESALAEWRTKWSAALVPLGLPSDSQPVVAYAVVAQSDDLSKNLADAAGLSQRIEDIERDSENFRNDVESLLQLFDRDRPRPGDSIHEKAEDLWQTLHRALADQKKLNLLQERRKEQEEKRRTAHDRAESLNAHLKVLCAEARCESYHDLPAIEDRAAEALRLRRDRQELQGELMDHAAGATMEELLAQAASVAADTLPGELHRIDAAMAEQERLRDELNEVKFGAKAVLDRMDGSAEAAEAAEDAQEILARLESDSWHYLRLRLASAVLREGIERYRKKNEGPVLSRASELFRRLTLGSFDALHIGFDDNSEQVLEGVRPDGRALLPDAMSEGTCDQLYLALRLASLENWLQRNEPLPLIVDDILVSFDNDRAAATLEVLAEVSGRTQVIFFSHHEHLVDLARRSISSETLFVHRL